MTNEEAIKEIKRRNCKGYKHEEMCQWAGEGFGSCEVCCYGLAIQALVGDMEKEVKNDT